MTKPRVTVLGTGVMGAGMSRSLLRSGLPVTVWNRSRDKADPLAEDGATVAADPSAAVGEADVVLTMLFDAASVREVMDEAMAAVAADAVWVQSSTVGPDGARDLGTLATRRGVPSLDAPVLGTRGPAEEGRLVVLASGDRGLERRVAPVLDAIGSRTVWVGGEVGQASALKLAVNSWVATLTAGVAQSLALAAAWGLDPALFLEAIGGGPTDVPYAHLKGAAMMADDFPVAFALSGMLKDLDLASAAAKAGGLAPRVTDALHDLFREAAEAGWGDEDMAAVHRVLRARRA